MKLGLFISGTLHALFILFAIVTLPRAFAPSELPSVVPVELMTVDEMTNIMARQEKEPEKEPEPEAQKPEPEPKKVAAIEPPPEPEPEEIVEKIPEKKDEKPKPEPKKVAEKKPDQKKLLKIRPRTKPKPPKKQFDLDQIAALLDKLPEEEKPIRTPKEVPGEPEKIEEAPKVGVGLQTGLTLSEEDAFRVQMQRCWSVPAGAARPEELIVTFRICLNEDGTLARTPELIQNSGLDVRTNSFYRAAAESALRALQRCQPYQLPIGKYAIWKDMEVTFNPSAMVAP